MYYAIELYEKEDITIKNIKNSHLEEIVEDVEAYKDRTLSRHNDCIKITDGKTVTVYFKDEEKRNKTVSNLLNCGEYLYDRNVFSYCVENGNILNAII